MAIGDEAVAAGYPLVPNTGEEGRVRHGAREINRTRDFLAQVRALIQAKLPGKITISSASPSGGANGDIWLKHAP